MFIYAGSYRHSIGKDGEAQVLQREHAGTVSMVHSGELGVVIGYPGIGRTDSSGTVSMVHSGELGVVMPKDHEGIQFSHID